MLIYRARDEGRSPECTRTQNPSQSRAGFPYPAASFTPQDHQHCSISSVDRMYAASQAGPHSESPTFLMNISLTFLTSRSIELL